MSDIAPVGQSNPANLETARPAERSAHPTPAPSARTGDKVELSTAAQLLSKLAELPDIRQELVDRVRTEIELGAYETPEKLDAAIEALADDLA